MISCPTVLAPVPDSVCTAALEIRTAERDSAIIEAARALGCAELISEDLGDGQDYDGVVVTNSFR